MARAMLEIALRCLVLIRVAFFHQRKDPVEEILVLAEPVDIKRQPLQPEFGGYDRHEDLDLSRRLIEPRCETQTGQKQKPRIQVVRIERDRFFEQLKRNIPPAAPVELGGGCRQEARIAGCTASIGKLDGLELGDLFGGCVALRQRGYRNPGRQRRSTGCD